MIHWREDVPPWDDWLPMVYEAVDIATRGAHTASDMADWPVSKILRYADSYACEHRDLMEAIITGSVTRMYR